MDERLCELKVWQFFSALDTDERKALYEILHTSAKTGTNDVLSTFSFFMDREAEIQVGKVTRGDLFRFLHGALPFDVNHFNKPISRLIGRIKEFWEVGTPQIMPHSSIESEIQCKLRLMQKLELHGLNTAYEYEQKKLDNLFETSYFYEDKYRHLASWKKIELSHNMRLHPHEPRPELWAIQLAVKRQYEIDQLRIEASIANQQKMATEMGFPHPENHNLHKSGEEEPIFQFYRIFIELQQGHDAGKWKELKSVFSILLDSLSQDLLAEISSLLISHASRARNAGEASMQGELLSVYQQIIDSGTLAFANWNLGPHLQNYLFLVGYESNRDGAMQALTLASKYVAQGKIHPSTGWLLKAIFEEFFGDKRKAYKYYFECISLSNSTIEIAVARSKQLVFDYEDRLQNPILPDYGHSYEVFLQRNIGAYPALRNHKNFVTCVRLLAAAYYAKPNSPSRQKKIQKCRAKIEGYDGQPMINKQWLLAQLDGLANDK